MHGGGRGSKLADEVVATIRAKGGVAVPNYGEEHYTSVSPEVNRACSPPSVMA